MVEGCHRAGPLIGQRIGVLGPAADGLGIWAGGSSQGSSRYELRWNRDQIMRVRMVLVPAAMYAQGTVACVEHDLILQAHTEQVQLVATRVVRKSSCKSYSAWCRTGSRVRKSEAALPLTIDRLPYLATKLWGC